MLWNWQMVKDQMWRVWHQKVRIQKDWDELNAQNKDLSCRGLKTFHETHDVPMFLHQGKNMNSAPD